jgi:hypothetical protein
LWVVSFRFVSFESYTLVFATRFWRWCAAVAISHFVFASAADAFSTIGTKWPQPNGVNSPITVTYSYQNLFDGALKMPDGQPLPKLLIRDSIEEALGLWAEVAPINFVEVHDDNRSYGQGSTAYGQIRFRHVFINGHDPPPPALPVAKAQAYYPSVSVNGGDVEFDDGDRWQEIGTTPVPDILGATIHELGHSLGLGHSGLEEAAMYWIFNRFSGIGTGQLHADDIAGIRAVYGTGAGSVTPLWGTWQDRARAPSSSSGNSFEYNSVPSGLWFDSAVVSELRFTADSNTFFSQIAEFPSGFEPMTLMVNGNVLGTFTGGQSFNFGAFPGGGVSEFVIQGVDTLGEIAGPLGLPLKLAFTTPTASFVTVAIPEPATLMSLFTALLALGGLRCRFG